MTKSHDQRQKLHEHPEYMAAVMTWEPQLEAIYDGVSKYVEMPGGNADSRSLKVQQDSGLAFYFGSTAELKVGREVGGGSAIMLTPLELAMHIKEISDYKVAHRAVWAIINGDDAAPDIRDSSLFAHIPDPSTAPQGAGETGSASGYAKRQPPQRTAEQLDAEIIEFCKRTGNPLHQIKNGIPVMTNGKPLTIKLAGKWFEWFESVKVYDPDGLCRFVQMWLVARDGEKTSRYATHTSDDTRWVFKGVFTEELRPLYYGEGRTAPRGDRPIEFVSGVHGQRVGSKCDDSRDFVADLFGDANIICDLQPLLDAGQPITFNPDDDDAADDKEYSRCEEAMRKKAAWLASRGASVSFRKPYDPRTLDKRILKPSGAAGGDIVDLAADLSDVAGGISKQQLREGVEPSADGKQRVRDLLARPVISFGSPASTEGEADEDESASERDRLHEAAGEARAAWIEAKVKGANPDETRIQFETRLAALKDAQAAAAQAVTRHRQQEAEAAKKDDKIQAAIAERERKRQTRIAKFGSDTEPGLNDEFIRYVKGNKHYIFFGDEEQKQGGRQMLRFQSRKGQKHARSVPATFTEDEALAALGRKFINKLLTKLRYLVDEDEDLRDRDVRQTLSDALRHIAARMPIYSPTTGHGYGGNVNGRLTYHLGQDYIDIERGETVPHDFTKRQSAAFRDLPNISPIPNCCDLTDESAEAAAEAARLWMQRRWDRSPLEGLLAFGHCGASLLAGFLHRRPAMIISGGKNAGKSDLVEKDYAGILADHRADVKPDIRGQEYVAFKKGVRDPSAAGIQQLYGMNRSMLFIDDANTTDSSVDEARRTEGVLDIIDANFGGGDTPRGTPSGAGRELMELMMMFVLTVGRPLPLERQGRDRRMIQLHMKSMPEDGFDEADKERFDSARKRLAEIYKLYGSEIRGRIIYSAAGVREACRDDVDGNLFAELNKLLGDHEMAQTIAPVMATLISATTNSAGECYLASEIEELKTWLSEDKSTKIGEAKPVDPVQAWLSAKVDITVRSPGGFGESLSTYRASRRWIAAQIMQAMRDQKPSIRNQKWITPPLLEWPSAPNANLVQVLLDDGGCLSLGGQLALDPGEESGALLASIPRNYKGNPRGWLLNAAGLVSKDPARFRRSSGGETQNAVLFERAVWEGDDAPVVSDDEPPPCAPTLNTKSKLWNGGGAVWLPTVKSEETVVHTLELTTTSAGGLIVLNDDRETPATTPKAGDLLEAAGLYPNGEPMKAPGEDLRDGAIDPRADEVYLQQKRKADAPKPKQTASDLFDAALSASPCDWIGHADGRWVGKFSEDIKVTIDPEARTVTGSSDRVAGLELTRQLTNSISLAATVEVADDLAYEIEDQIYSLDDDTLADAASAKSDSPTNI